MSNEYTGKIYTGRKLITIDEPVVDRSNILDVLAKVLPIHEQNRRDIDYLWSYYLGKQPITGRVKEIRPEINARIVENHASEIVSFFSTYVFGEACQYVQRGKCMEMGKAQGEEAGGRDVAVLNEVIAGTDKSTVDKELSTWFFATGTAYRMTLPGQVEPFDTEALDPRDAFVAYSSGFGKKPVFCCKCAKNANGEQQYGIYTDSQYFLISGNEVKENLPHSLGMLPIIEYAANAERTSVFEAVIPIMEAINNVTSDRVNAIAQFVQSIMVFNNCDIDEKLFKELIDMGAVKVKGEPGNPASVTLISAELKQSEVQKFVDYLYQTMLTIACVPDRRSSNSGNTGLSSLTSEGWYAAEAKAKAIELFFERSEKRFLKLVLKILSAANTGYDFSNLHISDIEIKFNRNKLDNLLVKCQSMMNLMSSGVAPRIAMATVGLFADSENAYLESTEFWKSEQAQVWKQILGKGEEASAVGVP